VVQRVGESKLPSSCLVLAGSLHLSYRIDEYQVVL